MSKPANFSTLRWIGIGLGLTGIALLSATAGALLAISLASTPLMQSQLSAEEASVFSNDDIASGKTLQLPELTRPVNILILGTKVLSTDLEEVPQSLQDLGYHATVDSLEGLTDTMLLVRFDPAANKLALLSIPRDTRTFIEGQGVLKINEANYHGGPALGAKTVSQLLGGVGIDRYIRVNVQAVEKLIDALGGVTIYVPHDMKYQDDSQHLYINLKAGKQHLEGKQAVQFLRYRHDSLGDIGRIQRQQMLMRSLIEQTLNPATISRLPKILSVIRSHLDTNLSVEELFALVSFAHQTGSSKAQLLMLPGRFSEQGEFEASYWIPDYEDIDRIMAQHFAFGHTATPVEDNPARLSVAIQDSTNSQTAIDELTQVLYDRGYGNVYVDETWAEPLQVTRIVAQGGDSQDAETLKTVLGFGEVRVESTGSLRSDITIQLGQDWFSYKSKLLNRLNEHF